MDLLKNVGFYFVVLVFLFPVVLFIGMTLLLTCIELLDKYRKKHENKNTFDIF